jgi:hypothetical protein
LRSIQTVGDGVRYSGKEFHGPEFFAFVGAEGDEVSVARGPENEITGGRDRAAAIHSLNAPNFLLGDRIASLQESLGWRRRRELSRGGARRRSGRPKYDSPVVSPKLGLEFLRRNVSERAVERGKVN